MIACVVISHFAAKLERAHNQMLRSVPLLVVRYGAKRGKVIALSLEAAAAGVTVGIGLSQARALCPQAATVSNEGNLYEQGVERLLDALWRFTNRVEIDETALPHAAICYLDLGQLSEPQTLELGNQLLNVLTHDLRLDASIGIASRKFPAYVGAVTDHPLTFVPRETSAAFVAPHPIQFLPLNKETERKLALLAFRTIGQLASLPREALIAQFGKPGKTLWLLAQGLDGRPVKPRQMPQSERAIQRIDDGIADQTALDRALRQLAEELADRLERRGAALHAISLTIQLKRGKTYQEQLHLLQPVASTKGITAALQSLLDRMNLQLQTLDDGITLIDIGLTHLVSSKPRQLELFTHKPARQELIDLATVLAQRYGDCFYEAVVTESDEILPERRFRLLRVDAS